MNRRMMTPVAKKRRHIVSQIEAFIYFVLFASGGCLATVIAETLCRWAGVG